MSTLSDLLLDAASTGEVVPIIYHGGSQPGSIRDVSPIRVTDREMRTREMDTGIVKTFLLERIQLPGQDTTAPRYNPEKATEEDEPLSLLEACEEDVGELARLGWHVELSETSISVHRYFKNGKPRKGADAGISKYDDNPSRPYYVFGPSLASARTFSRLTKAIQLFAEEAVKHAPVNAT